MCEQKIKKEVQLDRHMKDLCRKLTKDALDNATYYLAYAVETANRQAGIESDDFWEKLFVGYPSRDRKQTQHLLEPGKAEDQAAKACRAAGKTFDPYKNLDIQFYNKYLVYGTFREENGEVLTDSLNFFNFFGVPYQQPPREQDGRLRPFQVRGTYAELLHKAIGVRNRNAHMSIYEMESLTRKDVLEDRKTLMKLTEYLNPREGGSRPCDQPGCPDWLREKQPPQEYWKKFQSQFDQICQEPLLLDEVYQEVLNSEEELTEEQRKNAQRIAALVNLDMEDGRVYQKSRQNLISVLRELSRAKAPTTAEAAKARAEEVIREQDENAAKLRRRTTETFDPDALVRLSAAAAAELRQAGGLMELRDRVLQVLLDHFTPMVDESLFLSAEGRELLTERLAPVLMHRKERLMVDDSVVSALFRQFRSTTPYTDLELRELEAAERERLREQRERLHRESKNAIKALRFLRERHCLEVVYSPIPEGTSADNLFCVAEAFPNKGFLTMTMDRTLAEKLSGARGRNAVAVKPTLDGKLLLFRATRPAYNAILSRTGGTGKPEAVQPVRPAQLLPKAGDRICRETGDGQREELRLGKVLGQGGEGTIYMTSDPDGAVAKLYHPAALTEERKNKLTRMLQIQPAVPGLCWPQALLYSLDGRWIGFLMPRAEGVELARTVFHPGRNNKRINDLGWTRRSLALIAANIAESFAAMHREGVLMGDVNPRNFIIGQDCRVYLVDCDSYQFERFPCPVGVPLYTPPEVHKEMRRLGREDYGYIRTPENERYSLAVLLFEILMLGKPPYESRNTNNEDVIQAIIAGNFPYPYHSDDEGQEAAAKGNLLAPVGRWRQIWSHMTYAVKTSFYQCFAGRERPTAEQWAATMREYARQIEVGHSSDELAPTLYKVVSGQDGESAEMVELECAICHCRFNMGKDVYARRSGRELDLCNVHQTMMKNFQHRWKTVKCAQCGRPVKTTVAHWIMMDLQGKQLYCEECREVSVTCAGCGRTYRENRDRAERLAAQGKRYYCPECFNRNWPEVTCDRCGAAFRMQKSKLDYLTSRGRYLLCRKCLAEEEMNEDEF